jgi:hypothetical protein
MIIRPKSGKEAPVSVRLSYRYMAVVGVFMAVSLFALAWCLRDGEKGAPSAGHVGMNAAPEQKVLPPRRLSVAHAEAVSPVKTIPSANDGGMDIDSFKAGEEQAKRLYRKLEENAGISLEERSNIVTTIRMLESGRTLIQ